MDSAQNPLSGHANSARSNAVPHSILQNVLYIRLYPFPGENDTDPLTGSCRILPEQDDFSRADSIDSHSRLFSNVPRKMSPFPAN